MSNAVRITNHGASRMSQRGIGFGDIDMIMRIGSEVESGYLVRERDYLAFEREQKQILERARRLVGMRLVVECGQIVVSAYHANPGKQRRLLRGARDHSLGS